MAHSSNYELPAIVSSPADLRMLRRELENLDEFMLQAKLRNTSLNKDKLSLPKTSRYLDQLSDENNFNFLIEKDRQLALDFINTLLANPKQIKISFAVEPSAILMLKITAWIRDNIDKYALISVGLQPLIGVGCILETINHRYDFSLTQNFIRQKVLLNDLLKGDAKEMA